MLSDIEACWHVLFFTNQPFKMTPFQRKKKGTATISLNGTVLPTQKKIPGIPPTPPFCPDYKHNYTKHRICNMTLTHRFYHSTTYSQNQNPRYNSGKESINLLQFSIDIWQFSTLSAVVVVALSSLSKGASHFMW